MDEPAFTARINRKVGRRWGKFTVEPVSYAAGTSGMADTGADPKMIWILVRDVSANTSCCAACGIPVRLRDDPRRKVAYCSDKCRMAYYRHRRSAPKSDPLCDTCGNTFSGRSDARYCSPKCRQAAYRKRAR